MRLYCAVKNIFISSISSPLFCLLLCLPLCLQSPLSPGSVSLSLCPFTVGEWCPCPSASPAPCSNYASHFLFYVSLPVIIIIICQASYCLHSAQVTLFSSLVWYRSFYTCVCVSVIITVSLNGLHCGARQGVWCVPVATPQLSSSCVRRWRPLVQLLGPLELSTCSVLSPALFIVCVLEPLARHSSCQ